MPKLQELAAALMNKGAPFTFFRSIVGRPTIQITVPDNRASTFDIVWSGSDEYRITDNFSRRNAFVATVEDVLGFFQGYV